MYTTHTDFRYSETMSRAANEIFNKHTKNFDFARLALVEFSHALDLMEGDKVAVLKAMALLMWKETR